jgi:hypothetical protein
MTKARTFDTHVDNAVYDCLVHGFHSSTWQAAEERWRWLMAAHIVGQNNLRKHAHSHWLMLVFACESHDWKEAAGQLFRLALVPLGHALGRLPAGNIGRATVSAFRPMVLSSEMRQLIAQMRTSATNSRGR